MSTTNRAIWRGLYDKPRTAILNRIERLSDVQFAYLMLLPSVLLLGTMALWPLIATFEMSLHADNLFSAGSVGRFVGLDHYTAILSGQANDILPRPFFDLTHPFTSALTVTLIFTVVAVTIETVLGFGQALVLDKSFRGRRWVRVALIFPWAVPIVIQGMIFLLMFQPSIGFVVEPLQQLGVISSAPLSDSASVLFIVIIADVWKQSAFMALLILAGLQSIDRELYNVGKVAGASKWQQFKTITFPLVLPAVLVALLFRTIAAMKVYGQVETISNCNTLPTLSCQVVSTFNTGRYASAATIAFITAAIIGIILSVYIIKFVRMDRGGL
jgi:ABC-type sugar transport system permease subunit